MRNIGLLLFNDAEVLDFAGPFEVFSVCSELHDHSLFKVHTIGKEKGAIRAVNGLSVNADHAIESTPLYDILIIPGGQGSRQLIKDQMMLDWIKKQHDQTEITMTVCSGSLALAQLGILTEGMGFCTHKDVYTTFENIVPLAKPQKDKRFHQEGKIYTSGGISAGIDLSFHIIAKLHGKEAALKTAQYMEYDLDAKYLNT